ncbi:Efk-1 [Aphelenchoides besseyi]|nr:Efk-1 [Aphelenchoides besseyi]KAI6199211.1 Efk-1 [Aphelenchoides besseyi]
MKAIGSRVIFAIRMPILRNDFSKTIALFLHLDVNVLASLVFKQEECYCSSYTSNLFEKKLLIVSFQLISKMAEQFDAVVKVLRKRKPLNGYVKPKLEWPQTRQLIDKGEVRNSKIISRLEISKRRVFWIPEKGVLKLWEETVQREQHNRAKIKLAQEQVRQKTFKEASGQIVPSTQALAEMKKGKNVDICFVVDATESMGSHIKGVKDNIIEIIDGVQRMIKKQKDLNVNNNGSAPIIRLAFVAYRDFGDRPRIQSLPFTTSVMGGLVRASKLEWTSGDETVRILFHITDAPCHGNEYHDLKDDMCADGDPNGITPGKVFHLLRTKKVDYYFGRINYSTDKMIKKFGRANKQPVVQFNVGDVQNILTSVITAVRESLSLTSRCSSVDSMNSRLTEIESTLIQKVPDRSECAEVEAIFETFELPANLKHIIEDKPLNRRQLPGTSLRIALRPFAMGAERVVYYAWNLKTNQALVLKQFHSLKSGVNKGNYDAANQLQNTVAFLAEEFMRAIRSKMELPKLPAIIRVVRPKTVLVLADKGRNAKFYSSEPLFDAESHFIRFTTNADYVISNNRATAYDVTSKQVDLLTAFSHWTYHITKGELMVVDLQGVFVPAEKSPDRKATIMLTDPAIHSIDNKRFGSTNGGIDGMKEFFKFHNCNLYCQRLQLKR